MQLRAGDRPGRATGGRRRRLAMAACDERRINVQKQRPHLVGHCVDVDVLAFVELVLLTFLVTAVLGVSCGGRERSRRERG